VEDDARDKSLAEPNVRNVFEAALDDTKIGGNLERGLVTAVLAHGIILETAFIKLAASIDKQTEEMRMAEERRRR
jgi:hypothetical protein